MPATLGVSLSRLSTADIAREVRRAGLVATISDKTVWRWLHGDATRIYFSILQRKALTPNDFSSLADVEARLLGFERYDESIAASFDWCFTRDDLNALLSRLQPAADALRPAA